MQWCLAGKGVEGAGLAYVHSVWFLDVPALLQIEHLGLVKDEPPPVPMLHHFVRRAALPHVTLPEIRTRYEWNRIREE